MAIRIIEQPDLHLTQEEHDQLWREWQASQQYTTAPTSFESFVRARKTKSDEREGAAGAGAALVGVLALALLASGGRRKPRYDWVDHVAGNSLADKLLGR